jgi:XTP/dITP diphosphohydrolase
MIPGKVILSTGNTGKLAEIGQLLEGWDVVAQSRFDFAEVEETGLTFVENAILKARQACLHGGLAAIADDSGLEVDVLRGQPGIYSARYAGHGASDQENLDKLLSNMEQQTRRKARFRCVIVYMQHQHDPSPIICSGSWEGEIAWIPQGDNGFGYDPVFYLPALGKTAAQLSPEEKNRLSHRAAALKQLLRQLTPLVDSNAA